MNYKEKLKEAIAILVKIEKLDDISELNSGFQDDLLEELTKFYQSVQSDPEMAKIIQDNA